MKPFFILALSLSLALVQVAGAEDQPKKKKKPAAPNTASAHTTATAAHAPATVHKGQTTVAQRVPPRTESNKPASTVKKAHGGRTYSNAPLRTTVGTQSNVTMPNNQKLNKNQKFNQSVARNARVRQEHVAITNNWNGQSFSNQRYAAFRNYHREFHDRDWWRQHHSRIVFYFGAPYYWNTGYWYPAWGYNPGFTYGYDGPIYGYNGLAPDQVLMTVQTRLQQEGYYRGAVDGTIGPLTRQALADFQADHGLAVTAAVDEPTLATMGLS